MPEEKKGTTRRSDDFLALQETEDERQARYAREADEMKLKWDARPAAFFLEAFVAPQPLR